MEPYVSDNVLNRAQRLNGLNVLNSPEYYVELLNLEPSLLTVACCLAPHAYLSRHKEKVARNSRHARSRWTVALKTPSNSVSDQALAFSAATVSFSAFGTWGTSVPKTSALTPQVARAHSNAGP